MSSKSFFICVSYFSLKILNPSHPLSLIIMKKFKFLVDTLW